jgi:hypothetical protein
MNQVRRGCAGIDFTRRSSARTRNRLTSVSFSHSVPGRLRVRVIHKRRIIGSDGQSLPIVADSRAAGA